jgi:hypothetical protein
MHPGGTLREMFTLDKIYDENIFLQVAYENTSDKDFLCI